MLTNQNMVYAIYNDGATIEFKEPNKGTVSIFTTCTSWEIKPQKHLSHDCPTKSFTIMSLMCTGETTLQTAGVKLK